ncbi:hypothetical protein V1517DRAFT_108477 [Lipomyces orientalis]|uniref:Uncharacterized protein n=1 Tax=Lipomyces orientalis TaxID=1233043 RepID=A0ACC3TRG5_9ASCO
MALSLLLDADTVVGYPFFPRPSPGMCLADDNSISGMPDDNSFPDQVFAFDAVVDEDHPSPTYLLVGSAESDPIFDHDRTPYVGYLSMASLMFPSASDSIQPTPPLTPATTISLSSISSPIEFRPLSSDFRWCTTSSAPPCSSPVPYVNGVRLRDLFSPEFCSRYYSSSDSSSDESDRCDSDADGTYPGKCDDCDNLRHWSPCPRSDGNSHSLSRDVYEGRGERESAEDRHQSDRDADSGRDRDSDSATTDGRDAAQACDWRGEVDISYVERGLLSASPTEAVMLPMNSRLCHPANKPVTEDQKLRNSKTKTVRKSGACKSAHKGRPKAALVRDTEARANDYFSQEVHNGASYRSCEDVPFETIMQMPFYGERRPPRPFTHMIALALLSSPSTNFILSIEEIYQFISKRFPCFKMEASIKATKRWKSAVRHNLSFSSSFRKIAADSDPRKALPGGSKRCLWGFSLKSWEKQRLLRGHRGERLSKRK